MEVRVTLASMRACVGTLPITATENREKVGGHAAAQAWAQRQATEDCSLARHRDLLMIHGRNQTQLIKLLRIYGILARNFYGTAESCH